MSRISNDKFQSAIKKSCVKIMQKKNDSSFRVHVPLTNLSDMRDLKKCASLESLDFVKCIHENKDKGCKGIDFELEQNFCIENIIYDSITPTVDKKEPKTIVMDFSSPNIAKPFHLGHLRSTIIGNFIANINTFLNEKVVRINYLGDWGTQFGLLKVGIDTSNYTLEQIKQNPIQSLYNAYVQANKLAESDTSVSEKARLAFSDLEAGKCEDIDKWQMYREFTVVELKGMYARLGVTFDEYHWESMYNSKDIQNVIKDLEQKNILKRDVTGMKFVTVNDRNVTVLKSDGSTLYLTRDIAAVLDRYNKYKFDQMLYVVDNAQTDHFKALFNILEQMDAPFKNSCKHVKFGRVKGMSTRKGNIVFLKDVLDEARDKVHQQQINSATTKVDLDDAAITDILGTTAVIINDLKQHRLKDYDFSWENAIRSHGDTGVKLQYIHCRLWSLEQNCGFQIPLVCKPEFIQQPEALMVINQLAKFNDVVEMSCKEMEAFILVSYLFRLGQSINKALKVLVIKGQEKDVGEQRLLLFHAARMTVKRSLEILGIRPLNQM